MLLIFHCLDKIESAKEYIMFPNFGEDLNLVDACNDFAPKIDIKYQMVEILHLSILSKNNAICKI